MVEEVKHKGVRIVVEGKSDIFTIANLLPDEFCPKNFIIMSGKGNLLSFTNSNYRTLKKEIKNLSINKILFILDADCEEKNNVNDGYDNTKINLENHISEFKDKNNVENSDYIEFDYYIMPNNKDNGCLETLILSTLDDKIKDCYENFLDCTGKKKKDKGKLQIIYKLIGSENIDYDHINFKPLKDKLEKLI